MKNLIENFPEQLSEALGRVSTLKVPERKSEIRNIVIVGMGGSAFGAEVVGNYIANLCPVPLNIVRNYELPAFVNENTLLIFSSYSGNTEETLSALEKARVKNSEFLAISSNGKLREQTPENAFFALPEGYPPRTAIAFSITTLLEILHQYNLIPDPKPHLKQVISLLKQENFYEPALNLTEFIRYKFPLLYVAPEFSSVGIRFQQQLNENSKILAHYNVYPEMNHNEIVGWANANKFNENIAFILLKTDLTSVRNQYRITFMEDFLQKNYPKNFLSLEAQGTNLLSQLFYSIHLIDRVSLFLANKFGVDPVEVEIISKLKNYLSKI